MKEKIKSLVLGNIFFTSAMLTIIPWHRASENNFMGYKSICSWAPVSSFLCLAGALIQLVKLRRWR